MTSIVNTSNGHRETTEMKSMDANRYATKKTIAQGMLDIALLTANASQLKSILQAGHQHEFYKLMLVLVSSSIILQVGAGILSLSLSLMRDCRLHLPRYHRSANLMNHLRTAFAYLTVVITIGALLIYAGLVSLHEGSEQRVLADRLNHITLGLVLIALFCDVIKMSFVFTPDI